MSVWDIIVIVLFLLMAVLSVAQGLLRQAMMLFGFYFATLIAGFTYNYVATFMTAFTPNFRSLRESISFLLVFLIIVIIVEVFHRKGFPQTKLPKLKALDNVLGIIPGVLSGLVLAVAIISCLGHTGLLISEEQLESMVTYPFLSAFMNVYQVTLSVFYLGNLPPLLRFLLPNVNAL
ncbi:MAG: CvpA family protein [Anaerolineae bacterium]|nr:CvpA family protein [Anaerolineae bacterium]